MICGFLFGVALGMFYVRILCRFKDYIMLICGDLRFSGRPVTDLTFLVNVVQTDAGPCHAGLSIYLTLHICFLIIKVTQTHLI